MFINVIGKYNTHLIWFSFPQFMHLLNSAPQSSSALWNLAIHPLSFEMQGRNSAEHFSHYAKTSKFGHLMITVAKTITSLRSPSLLMNKSGRETFLTGSLSTCGKTLSSTNLRNYRSQIQIVCSPKLFFQSIQMKKSCLNISYLQVQQQIFNVDLNPTITSF